MSSAVAAPAAASAVSGQQPVAKSVPNPVTAPKQDAQAPAPDFKQTKHKVKFGGQEAEVDYDELVRGYQNGRESTRRYQEASQLAQQAKQIESALESGDVNFLVQKLGPDKARKVFEDYLIEQMTYEQLPPAEKARRAAEKKAADLEAKLAERDKDSEKQAYDVQAQKAYEDLDRDIGDALKAAGKSSTPKLALKLLDHYEAHLKGNGEAIPMDKALAYSLRSLKQENAALLSEMDPAEAFEYFPQEFIDKLMKHQVSQVMGDKSRQPRRPAQVKEADQKPTTMTDWFKEKEKQLKGRR